VQELLFYNGGVFYEGEKSTDWFQWNGTTWVATYDPRGVRPTASANGTVLTTTTGTIVDASGVTWALVNATPDDSHVLTAEWRNSATNPIVSYSATITVPPIPTSVDNQFVDIWIGLQPDDASYVVQPVLQYSGSAGTWRIASFYAVGPTIAQQSAFVSVTPGTVINLVITCTGVSGSAYNYQIQFTGYGSTVLNVTGVQRANWAIAELEVAFMQVCANYPAQAVLQSIAINTGTPGTAGTSATPTWSPIAHYTDCGLGITINSPTQITFASSTTASLEAARNDIADWTIPNVTQLLYFNGVVYAKQ
jgi:hypothetical protein